MAQLVQVGDQAKVIANLFKVNRDRIIRAAPKGLDPNRLLSVAFNAIAYNTDLLACTQVSLIGGAMEAIKLGLTLGGPMQEAWLIPFKEQGVPKATLVIGYQGYRNLIDRSRSVISLHPRAVHNGMIAGALGGDKRPVKFEPGTPDQFEYRYGDDERIIHLPKNEQPEWKEQLTAVYAVAKLRAGGKQMEVLLLAEVEKHRNRSKAKNNGPWVSDYVPMAMKTAVRKIAKYLPKQSLELARAMELDDQADAGMDQAFDTFGLEITDAPAPAPAQPVKALDAVKETIRQTTQPAEKVPAEPIRPLTDDDIPFG